MTNNAHRWAPFLLLAFLVALIPGSGVRAQSESESCTSFTLLEPDLGPDLSYSVPLHYGSFADVEIGSASEGTVQLEVTVFEESAIKDRRIWTLVPRRVELATEILGVENLLEIGSPLLVRIEASGPVSAILVRKD
ncbi:MAG: hypothetical protein ACRD21_07845 [Vicinamibacteria bacterium]